jgi:hypothetical protein
VATVDDTSPDTNVSGIATSSITIEGTTGTADIEALDNNRAGNATLTVQDQSANFNVSNVSPDGASVTQGDNISTVSADIENTGQLDGTQDIEFQIDTNGDDQLDTTLATNSSFSVDAGETRTVTFSNIPTDSLSAGTYTHGVVSDDGQATASITITEPGTTLGTLNVSLSPDTVTANQSTDVTVTVTNDSSGNAVPDADVSISSLGLSNTTDSNGEATLSVNASSTGSLTVDATASGFQSANTSITVQAGGGVTVPSNPSYDPTNTVAAQFDSDKDGNITQPELGAAGQQYLNNALTQTELGRVGQGYLASQ